MAEEKDTKPTKKLGVFPQDKRINPDRLNDELKAALGAKLVSLETGQLRNKTLADAEGKPVLDDSGKPLTAEEGPFIYVIVTSDATEADLAAVEQLLKDHDPEQLSAVQQKQQDAIDAYARLGATDFAAMRKLDDAAQRAAILDLLEDWQRLMVAARG